MDKKINKHIIGTALTISGLVLGANGFSALYTWSYVNGYSCQELEQDKQYLEGQSGLIQVLTYGSKLVYQKALKNCAENNLN